MANSKSPIELKTPLELNILNWHSEDKDYKKL